MAEQFQRQTAYKLRIGDLLRGKPILENENTPEQRFKFLELGDKIIIRVNIVANIIDKYLGEGERKYMNFTIDDASGQIRLKVFGEDVAKFEKITQGNTIIIIGTVRFYNNELYLSPEIIKIIDPRYLLVRKLELDKEKPKLETANKEEIKAIKDQIIDLIKKQEDNNGIESDTIYHTLTGASPDIISQEITKLLEEGLIYEPRPGKLRYLG